MGYEGGSNSPWSETWKEHIQEKEIFILRGSVFTICTLLNSTMKFQKQNSVSSSPSFGRDESTLAMKIPKSVIC